MLNIDTKLNKQHNAKYIMVYLDVKYINKNICLM